MKKIKKWFLYIISFVFISNFSFFSIASCSNNDAQNNLVLKGGSLVISGSGDGQDHNFWMLLNNNDNCSNKAKWAIEPEVNGVVPRYNKLSKGVFVSWTNLSSGTYTFKVKTTLNDWTDAANVIYSNEINLIITDTSIIHGGSTILKSKSSTGADSNAWVVTYNSINYSADARWSIRFIKHVGNINISYDSTLNGAVINWEDLSEGEYIFNIDCIFKPKGLSFDIRCSTDAINLTIAKTSYICVRGASNPICGECGTAGHDTKPIFCFYDGVDDVTSLTIFTLDVPEEFFDQFYITYEYGFYYIAWHDGIGKPTSIPLTITARYNHLEVTSEVIYQVIFN